MASSAAWRPLSLIHIYTPEVKEQLERFGIPVLVERSSYESGPLARMEWIKFYGILLGKEELAQQVFDRQAERIAPLLDQQSTGCLLYTSVPMESL